MILSTQGKKFNSCRLKTYLLMKDSIMMKGSLI